MNQTAYLNAAQVQERFGGVSKMWIWRRLRNDGFPAPIVIGNRRYWRIEDVEAWEQAQAAASTRPPPGDVTNEAGHEG